MEWIAVERGFVKNKLYLLCGRNYWGENVMDFGFWNGDEWDLATNNFEPQFYAVIEWPPELEETDGEAN